ncbi:MAG: MoaD/ThiS family protein [Vampirovibrionia bacterium]
MSNKVLVEYTGVIVSHSGQKQEWVSIDNTTNVENLLTNLGYRKEHQRFIIVTIDGQKANLETPLNSGAAVSLFLPTGGG